jgi:hypothetical protein
MLLQRTITSRRRRSALMVCGRLCLGRHPTATRLIYEVTNYSKGLSCMSTGHPLFSRTKASKGRAGSYLPFRPVLNLSTFERD